MVRKPGMRRAPLALKTAIPLCVLMLACVEQDEDKPTAEDMTVAKQNILTTAPTPKYAVNADLDGKVVYLGLDVDHAPIEPGKDVTLTHYWKVVSPVSEWKTFTHLNGAGNKFINADHAPVKGKYPVSAWKARTLLSRPKGSAAMLRTWSRSIRKLSSCPTPSSPLALVAGTPPRSAVTRPLRTRWPGRRTSR